MTRYDAATKTWTCTAETERRNAIPSSARPATIVLVDRKTGREITRVTG